MEIKFSDLLGAKIICDDTRLGVFNRFYVQSESGKILGITNKSGKFFPGENVLKLDKEIALSIPESSDKEGGDWLLFKVKSVNGKNYGRVNDIWVDQNGLQVNQFSTSKFFFGFAYSKRIFPISSIFQVVDKSIIVDDEIGKKVDLNLAKNISFSQ